MSETDLRRGYDNRRVLIEVEHVLTPRFDAIGVYLLGEELEMLRNVTQYLGEQATFVDAYYQDYYMMADNGDWDTIQATVANIERKLMGNENVLWGFNDHWSESLASLQGSDGTAIKATVPVPAGKVLVFEALSWRNTTGARGSMQLQVLGVSDMLILADLTSPAQYVAIKWQGSIALTEGEYILIKQNNCLENDVHAGSARGYLMDIPE